MTESEKQNIIQEIIETLNQYSKTISQLELTSQAADDDIIELGNGKRISVADLLKGANVDIEELKKLFLRKDQPDRTDFPIDFTAGLGLGKDKKHIRDLIRYYDEKEKEDADKTVATDADIYSALMTDQRIKDSAENLDKRYIRKDKEDIAHKHITFEEGITVYQLADMMNINVKELATIAQAVVQILRSERFVDGFAGEGYQIWKDIASGDWNLTIDRVTVRKVMTIYELIIQKIRSVGGMLLVSAANGKVKTVQKVGNNYVFTFEDANMFEGNDLARCQVFTGKDVKYYWVKVATVSDHRVIVPESEFAGVIPAEGDEWVLMGNTTNKRRQSCILISATEDGQPRFDCYDGIKTKNLEGCLKVRVGNLDGISDSRFPASLQPSGHGLYGNNCFLTGVFVLVNGKDVMTMFQIMEGLIKSEISSVRAEINQKDNYLSNASFSNSLSGWVGNSNIRVFTVNGKLLAFNNNLYANKGAVANIVDKDNRNVLRIKNSSIMQLNADLAIHPEFEEYEQTQTDEEGNEIVTGKLFRPRMFYVSFKYRCASPGTLRIYFKGENAEGFEEYEPVDCTEVLQPTGEFKAMEVAGKWNGTGDFVIEFSGDIYLYSLAMADNRLADMEDRFNTKFEQTDKMIRLSAEEIRKNGKKLEEYHSEFTVTARNIRAELTEGLDQLEKGLTEDYKGYVDITARQLTVDYTAAINDTEKEITESYNSAIAFSAKGLRTEFTADLENLESGITEAYKGAIDVSAQGLTGAFNQKITDLRSGITDEYTAAISLSAQGLSTTFNSLIDTVDGKVTSHIGSFHVSSTEISGIVSRIDTAENGISGIKQTINTAGWITTAEGNRLWADRNLVTDFGNILINHTSSFHATADRIEGIVDRVTTTEGRIDVVGTKITQLDKSFMLSINKATGFAINKDLKFKLGTNGISLYNNSGGEAVTVTRYETSENSGEFQLRIQKVIGNSSPGLGGFTFSTQTRANAVFECRFTAMIPIGYALNFASNAIGDDSNSQWVASNAGTGDWAEYRYQVFCGDSGSFSTTNFFYLTKKEQTPNDYNTSVTWSIKEGTVFDLSGYEDPVTYINLTDGLAKIKAANIEFEGAVSANKTFKIHPDGSMESTSGKIGGFSITSYSIGSEGGGDSMWLSKDGLSFKNSDREARIGLCMPASTGTSNVVAGLFSTKLDDYDFQYGGISTLMVGTSGGTFGSALSIRTDNRSLDVAIDFKGRINTNGKSKYGNDYGDIGLTGIFVLDGVWYNNTWAKTSLHFVDGILVRVIYNTPH